MAGTGAAVVSLLAACCVATVSLVRGHVLGRLYNDIVLDNYDHLLPCAELPTSAEVSRIVHEHEDVLKAIKDVNPGQIFVEVDDYTCPGRADIIISYATHQDRLAIEEIIDGHTFFGVPCRLRNI